MNRAERLEFNITLTKKYIYKVNLNGVYIKPSLFSSN